MRRYAFKGITASANIHVSTNEIMIEFIIGFLDSKLFAAIIGVFCGYWLSVKANRRQRYFEAAGQFREAFFDEIIICEQEIVLDSSETKISEVMSNALIKYKKAILRFRPFIDKMDVGNFDRVCQKYCDNETRLSLHAKPVAGVCKDNTFVATNEKEKRDIFLSQIKKLLEYATIK